MKQFGIRTQVALLTLIPSLIMVVSLEAWFLHDRFSGMDEDLLERGKLVARQLASSSEYGVFSSNQEFLQNIAKGVLQQPDVRGLAVLNSASETLVRAGEFSGHLKDGLEAGDGELSDYLNRPQFKKAEDKEVNLLTPIRSNERSLWIYHPIIPAQVPLGEFEEKQLVQQVGSVVVEMDRLRMEQAKTRMLRFTLLATLLFVSIVLYLVHRASRSITRPVRQLSEAVQAIGEGKLDTRIVMQSPVEELDTLAQGLNQMTEDLQEEHGRLEQRVEEATQALRLKKEEAERASYDKSRFLAVASHDLRQPLHALGLYIAELQHRISDAGQQHLVGQVEQSVEALSTLLNALLDISKLDAGSIMPQVQNCDMNAMLERVAADYRMVASIKSIRLVVRPCNAVVTSDPLLLERILTNLVSNAIRYTYPNGCVLVACRCRGRLLRIEVRDNGVGISREDQTNVFREFFQLSQPQLDATKGLGLGLSIVNRLVKLLGHRIDLRSAPNKGSVFAVEVPVAIHPGRQPAATAAAQTRTDSERAIDSHPLEGKKLLVVDDDPMVLAGTAGILASWGCEVTAAASLAEVERHLREGARWDFIISDYQLGNDANGVDVITRVRMYYNRLIPSLLISGDTSPTVMKLASVNGHHLLHKPVKPAKLRSLVLHLLGEEA
ncbi:MAG: hypothetical protein A2Z95_03640 [Gallionellales bacterium GWA2_60_18]|nr:MAG: hypothetical protein A2Z95_03640 [Gallionellales bacterium GWA2_60_18]